jgi:hypothetical protein
MSALTQRAAVVPRWSDLLLERGNKRFFLLGQNARGRWVIRDNTGTKAGLFLTREDALRFARLESADQQYEIVPLSDRLEFDYAAQGR